jgi:transcriptional regulator of heat shock response
MTVILLTPRQRQLLSRVIEEYIQTAEPVSSKAIVSSGAFDVQSATIRNEMADLEDMGFLAQLHTSGGRVPTPLAYRLYVNDLVANEGVDISHALRRRVDEALAEADLHNPEAINKTLARLIGQLSNNLVIANITEQDDAYKFGLSNLLAFPEFREMDRLVGLTEFFDQFESMCGRLHHQMYNGGTDLGVKVIIGTENPFHQIQDEAVVVAKYRLPRGHQGSLTLVGPMRMDYRKNLGLMTYAAQIANRITAANRN